MKIALLRKKYTYHGGAEGFSSGFIESLAKAGHEIHVFAIAWQTDSIHGNIHFHKVPVISGISFLRDLTFALSSYFMLRRRRKKFDIIQTHDKTLLQDIYRAGDGCHIEWLRQRWRRVGAAGKISVILNPYHWLILLLERSILRGHRFKKIIAISEMVKRNIIDNYGVPAADIEVIYNGVDLTRFHPGNRNKYRHEVRRQYKLTDDEPVILFVGSGFERKGVKYLIKAVESVSEPAALMIAGKGTPPSASRRQKIIFCGPQREIHKYYAAADIFVFPTIYEPFGNVHLEALASGLPVITTRSSGAAEIIEEGVQGFVVDKPEAVDDMSEKIAFMLRNSEQRHAMGLAARRLAEEFTFERHMGKIRDLYKKIIEDRKSQR